MDKKRIAVVFGGCSSEHEVSCVSAASVINNLPKDKYEIVCLGITKDGRWYLFSGSPEEIADGRWEHDPLNQPAFISPDRSIRGIVVDGQMGFDVIKVDCVFPVLHGKNGEDGTVQGLLQLSGIPFVGCRALASADCMDKAVTHTLLTAAGIHQANYLWFYAEKYKTGAAKIKLKIDARLGYPIFVKPANAGSSVGVSKVSCEAELDEAVAKAAHEDDKIVVEEAITGQEVECAVLGNTEPEASTVGEIAASAEFYDYDDKYKSGKSQLYIPAHLDETVMEEIRSTAVRAFRMTGCSGLARVDFFVRNGKEVILNELNTMPGFTSISMYPKLWEASGVPYSELLDKLVTLSFEIRTQY
ncbi:D-alanine--D-alanine ligase family protein [Caproiciproducens sp.]|uniref:D-alanine--D-alanine ligase family protein n=1 Tax=Caproiciproducens sp. TaxID=1954376 RepID=UPI002899B670|nr:D-alanine--D-alanine ligase family protein [Caproiciproducens sp.]